VVSGRATGRRLHREPAPVASRPFPRPTSSPWWRWPRTPRSGSPPTSSGASPDDVGIGQRGGRPVRAVRRRVAAVVRADRGTDQPPIPVEPNPSAPCPAQADGRRSVRAPGGALRGGALRPRPPADGRPALADRRRLPGEAVADAGLELGDIDGLSTYPGAIGMGMSEGGVTAVEEALRLHPTWINGGGDLPGRAVRSSPPCWPWPAGLCRHVLCFRTVWESTFAALGLRGWRWSRPVGLDGVAGALRRPVGGQLDRHERQSVPASLRRPREMLGMIALNGRRQRGPQPGRHLPGPDDHGRLPVGPAHHLPVRPLRLRCAL
jgi:hypothetical protein